MLKPFVVGAVILAVLLLGMLERRAAEFQSALQDAEITESSGLAASLRTPGVLWTINDSGGPPLLFATDRQGRALGRFVVVGAANRDWEEIAAGIDGAGNFVLYLADTGDDRRGGLVLYRLPEPIVDVAHPTLRLTKTAPAEAFPLNVPTDPVNLETMLVHPLTGEILFLAKRWGGQIPVYAVGPLVRSGQPVALSHVADVDLPAQLGILDAPSGGAVSLDGSRVVVRTAIAAYQWPVPGASLVQALSGTPRVIPLFVTAWQMPSRDVITDVISSGPDDIWRLAAQGEGVTYDLDGDVLLVSGEGSPCLLFAVFVGSPLTPA